MGTAVRVAGGYGLPIRTITSTVWSIRMAVRITTMRMVLTASPSASVFKIIYNLAPRRACSYGVLYLLNNKK